MRRFICFCSFFLMIYTCVAQDSLAKIKLKYPQVILKTTPIGFFYAIHYFALSTEKKFSSHQAYEVDLGFVNPYTGIKIMPQDQENKYGFRLINTYKYYFFDDVNEKNKIRNRNQYLGFDLQSNFHQVKTEMKYCRYDCLYYQLYPTTKQTKNHQPIDKFAF